MKTRPQFTAEEMQLILYEIGRFTGRTGGEFRPVEELKGTRRLETTGEERKHEPQTAIHN